MEEEEEEEEEEKEEKGRHMVMQTWQAYHICVVSVHERSYAGTCSANGEASRRNHAHTRHIMPSRPNPWAEEERTHLVDRAIAPAG